MTVPPVNVTRGTSARPDVATAAVTPASTASTPTTIIRVSNADF